MPSVFCTSCGREARPSDRFCRACGEALDDAARAAGPVDEAESLAGRGLLNEAIITIQRALGEQEVAELHVALSTLYLRRGSLGDAQRELQRAINLDPRCALAHAYAGALRARSGRIEEAQEHLDLARDIAPNDIVVSLKRAELWNALGILGRARDELRQGLQNGGGTRETRAAASRLLGEVEHKLSRSATRVPVRLPGLNVLRSATRRVVGRTERKPELPVEAEA